MVFADNSYRDIVDHNAMLRALRGSPVEEVGICVDDLFRRLVGLWREGLGGEGSREALLRRAASAVWREAVGENRRLALASVELVKWVR